MADVITRFKLETTQFDSKLRDKAKQLQGIAQQAEKAGKDFAGFDKGAIEAARALGTVASGATNTKDKLKDLVGSFNDAAKAYNMLSEEAKNGEFGKAMAESLQKLQQDIKQTKDELYGLGDAAKGKGGGGLFAGLGDKMSGALQVFGGNLMTKGTGMLAGLASEMGDMVKQGVELAKQGEGIRIAFERLGRGDILDGLRQATHGTVTDIELMKAAVKFNDFKLPLDQLGTMLAFAQQKAKDTGDSVDNMVNSIVTGLGRQSLMILDNLGLSATEIKERMKQTGDMTKAVGEIIREQMAKAGDYVETAADRAAQANTSLLNKMDELGRKFAPLEEASNNFWTSMKIGILDVIGGPLTNLLNKLTQAGRMANAYGLMGGNAKVGRMIANLANAREGNRQSIYQQQQENIWRYINRREKALKDRDRWFKDMGNKELGEHLSREYQAFGTADRGEIQAQIDAAKKVLREYQQSAKQILSPVKADIDTKGAEQNVESLKMKLIELEAQRKKAIAAGDTDLSKNLAKQISQVKSDIKGLNPTALSTTHKATPQETAANKVKDAERIYTETLLKNSIRLEAGLDSTLDNKKKELSAQERLFDAYNDAYATYKDPAYKEASKQAAEKIKQLAEEVKSLTDTQEASKKAARELESAQKKLADAQQKLADAQATGSATAVYKAQKDVDRQQEVVNRLQNPSLLVPAKPTGFEAYKQSVKAEIKFDQMQVDENTLHTLLQTALKNGLDNLTVDYSGLQERIAKGIDIPDSTWEALQEEINAKLKDLGIEPIKIPIETTTKDVKAIAKAASMTADVVGSIGDAFNAIEDPAAKVMGIVMQAIASVALGYAQATVAASQTGNPWVWAAFAAAGLAQMIAMITTIHSQTGYAEGGMIKGNSYSGDRIGGLVDGSQFVGLNAGEVVLNAAQQSSLAQQLEGGGMQNLRLDGVISGENIHIVHNRYLKRSGQGELVTW
jgi:hypothetical protein